MRHFFYFVLGFEVEIWHMLNRRLQYSNTELLFDRRGYELVFAEILLFPAFYQVVDGFDGGVGFVETGTDVRGDNFEVFVHALDCGEKLVSAGTCGPDGFAHFVKVEAEGNLAQFALLHDRNKRSVYFFMSFEFEMGVFVFHHLDEFFGKLHVIHAIEPNGAV